MSSLSNIPVAILCGGLGTRLGSLAQELPKALMDIHGRPFLEYQLELLARNGFRRVVLCTGHLGGAIVERMSRSHFGLEVSISDDGPELLGTAGSLRQAHYDLGESCFVCYGDSYMPCDYAELWEHYQDQGKPVLRTRYQGHDYGVYIMNQAARLMLPSIGSLSEVLEWWHPDKVANLRVKDRYYEIGTPETLAAAREFFASHRLPPVQQTL